MFVYCQLISWHKFCDVLHLSVCQEMETEAHCEMKEIEEMLSLFGSDAPSTTKDSQDKRSNHLISAHVCLAILSIMVVIYYGISISGGCHVFTFCYHHLITYICL